MTVNGLEFPHSLLKEAIVTPMERAVDADAVEVVVVGEAEADLAVVTEEDVVEDDTPVNSTLMRCLDHMDLSCLRPRVISLKNGNA